MKRRVKMSAVLLALLFALTVILSPRPAYAGGFSISPEEVEKSVARIRGWYYAEDYDSNGIEVKYRSGDKEWELYLRGGQLFFAYAYDDSGEWRMYFEEDHLIRFIDEEGEKTDYPNTSLYADWEEEALLKAYGYLPAGYGGGSSSSGGGASYGDIEAGDYGDVEGGGSGGEDVPLNLHTFVGKYTAGEDTLLLQYVEALDSVFVTWRRDGSTELVRPAILFPLGIGGYAFVADPDDPDNVRYVGVDLASDGTTLILEDKEKVKMTRSTSFNTWDIKNLSWVHYAMTHAEYYPPVVDAEEYPGDGECVVHLYEIVDDGDGYGHTATSDWYYIYTDTLEGTNLLGDEVDLLEVAPGSVG